MLREKSILCIVNKKYIKGQRVITDKTKLYKEKSFKLFK